MPEHEPPRAAMSEHLGIEAVQAPDAPAAIGPYSQGVVCRGLFFSAGQVGLDPVGGELVGSDVVTQARRVFSNLEAVLAAAGLGFGDVLKTTVYLVDMDEFAAMNSVYAEHFEAPFPARSTVAVMALPKGARVEIEVVARCL